MAVVSAAHGQTTPPTTYHWKSQKAQEFMSKFFGTTVTTRVMAVMGGLWLLCATVMPVAQAAPQASPRDAALPQTIAFNRDIRPILSDKCFKCHGPGTQFATLRFDLEDGAKHALTGGRFAIV